MDKTAMRDRVRALKKHFSFNNVELAEKAGVTKQAIGGWLNHGNKPQAEALLRLREALGVSERWLLYGEGEMLIAPPPDDFIKTMSKLARTMSEADKASLLDVARRYALSAIERG